MNWTEDDYYEAVPVTQAQRDEWIDQLKNDEDVIWISSGDSLVIKQTDELGFVTIYDCKIRRAIDGDPT